MKKPSRKTLIRNLDNLLRDYIRNRDGWKCVCCGVVNYKNENEYLPPIQWGHLWTAGTYATRWDTENGYAQCRDCNLIHEHDFYPMSEAVRKILGEEKYHALHKRFWKPKPLKDWELKELLERLKGELGEE